MAAGFTCWREGRAALRFRGGIVHQQARAGVAVEFKPAVIRRLRGGLRRRLRGDRLNRRLRFLLRGKRLCLTLCGFSAGFRRAGALFSRLKTLFQRGETRLNAGHIAVGKGGGSTGH